MDDAFGNALAVEMLHLLEELDVLHEQWAARARGQRLLRGDRGAVQRGERGRLVSAGATGVTHATSAYRRGEAVVARTSPSSATSAARVYGMTPACVARSR